MTEYELISILHQGVNQATIYSGEYAKDAKNNLERYLALPYGDEIQDRSQVVSTDCQDVVESDMPSLVRIFLGQNDALKFEPVNDSDEAIQEAEDKTKFVNWIVRNQPNSFKFIHDWMKDGLIQDIAVIKYYFEDTVSTEEHTYENVSETELVAIMDSLEGTDVRKVEIVGRTEPNESGEFDVLFRTTRGKQQIKMLPIPVESFIITRNATDLEEAELVGDIVRKTRSQLMLEGFSRELIDKLPKRDVDERRDTGLKEIRFRGQGGEYDTDLRDWASEEVEIYDLYAQIDYDGDGIAERRHIMMSGNNVLINEPFDHVPYAALSAISMPHKLIGRSRVTITKQTQRVKTSVIRQMLDNMYMVNNPRIAINENVDIDDMLTVRPNGLVRVEGEMNPGQAMYPVEIPYIGDKSLMTIQYMDQWKANTTGNMLANQGLDADALAKETATRFKGIEESGAAKVELIARNFAETGFRKLYNGIAWMATHYQTTELEVMVLGKPMLINPSKWKYESFCVSEVGLAVGDDQDTLQSLGFILQQQYALLQQGSPLIDQKKIYNTLTKMSKISDLVKVDEYFNDPEKPEEMLLAENEILNRTVQQLQGMVQQNPLAEAESIKAQADLLEAQAKQQMEAAKMVSEQEKFKAEMVQKQQQQDRDFALKLTEMEQKAQQDLNAQIQQNMLVFDPTTGSFIDANSPSRRN